MRAGGAGLGENHQEQEFGLGPVTFEVPLRYPCGVSSGQLGLGCWRLRKGSWAGI